MEANLVSESIKFMILGMGIVFIFLYLLVLLMQFQAWIISKYFPELPSNSKKMQKIDQISDDEERARVAAIVGAVIEYRKSKAKS